MRLNPVQLLNRLQRNNLLQPKVLMIEDSHFDQVLIRKIVETHYPFTLIDRAETKSEGLEKLTHNEYDLVLLDLRLPDSQGLEDIKEFRTRSKASPLIIITAYMDAKAHAAAVKFGADGIIDKKEMVNTCFSNTLENAVMNIHDYHQNQEANEEHIANQEHLQKRKAV